MKTKTAYLIARKRTYADYIDFVVFDFIPTVDGSCIYHVINKIEVAIPDLSQDELDKLMAGAELQALIEQKEKINAETFRRLAQIDERIGQLQALEDLS